MLHAKGGKRLRMCEKIVKGTQDILIFTRHNQRSCLVPRLSLDPCMFKCARANLAVRANQPQPQAHTRADLAARPQQEHWLSGHQAPCKGTHHRRSSLSIFSRGCQEMKGANLSAQMNLGALDK